MTRFIFWQRWLFYSSLVFAAYGIVLATASNNPFFLKYNLLLAQIFFHQQNFPQGADNFKQFILGPLGGTIACAYILLAFIAWFPFQRKERWSRDAILLAYGVWFVFDSLSAYHYGVYVQIYFINAFSMLVKLLPIMFTWKEFIKSNLSNT